MHNGHMVSAHLEALVLKDTLDGSVLAAGRQLGLEDDTERTIAYDLALCIRQVFVVAGQAVLNFLADDLCWECFVSRSCGGGGGQRREGGEQEENLPPILRDEKADGRLVWDMLWC